MICAGIPANGVGYQIGAALEGSDARTTISECYHVDHVLDGLLGELTVGVVVGVQTSL